MSELSGKPFAGGMFPISDLPFQEIFTPEDFTNEHRDTGNAVDDFIKGEITSRGEEIEMLNNQLSRELMKKAGILELTKNELEGQIADLNQTIKASKDEKDKQIVELKKIEEFNTSLVDTLRAYFGKKIVSNPAAYSKAVGILLGFNIIIRLMRREYEPCEKAYGDLLGKVAQNSGLDDKSINVSIGAYRKLHNEHYQAIEKIRKMVTGLDPKLFNDMVQPQLAASSKILKDTSLELVRKLFPTLPASIELLSNEWKGNPVLLLQDSARRTRITGLQT